MLLLLACVEPAVQDSPGHTDSQDSEQQEVEDCANGVDDDRDSLADCDDLDCPCAWPDALQHNLSVDFTGQPGQCAGGSYSFADCTLSMTSQLTPTDANACPHCDRTFAGALTVHDDTCEEPVRTPPPSEVAYGIVFASESWAVSVPAGEGWAELLVLPVDDHGGYSLEVETELRGPVEGCDGEQLLGTLSTSFILLDPPI